MAANLGRDPGVEARKAGGRETELGPRPGSVRDTTRGNPKSHLYDVLLWHSFREQKFSLSEPTSIFPRCCRSEG